MQRTPHTRDSNSADSTADDPLIGSTVARRLGGGVSGMTLWRWVQAGIIPHPLKIRGRNYWRRTEFVRALEAAADEPDNAA